MPSATIPLGDVADERDRAAAHAGRAGVRDRRLVMDGTFREIQPHSTTTRPVSLRPPVRCRRAGRL